ncbi:hypothetical protein BY996DRAFT_6430461 [Phakopsora pachyrhizi]|nr:hypothetical protein BY996DRAFT_6430461 [Phakopsora pachyrhizi]
MEEDETADERTSLLKEQSNPLHQIHSQLIRPRHNQQQQQSLLRYRSSTDSTHFLRPIQSHSLSTEIILSSQSPPGFLSSSALNENDLSVEPVGLDLGSEYLSSFRRSRLITLDIFRGSILCLQTLETSFEYLSKYSGSGSPSYLYWHQHVKFPLPRIEYSIRILTMVCTPALHFLLGCSCVFSLNTRRSLGWRSFGLISRSIKLGSILLVLNQCLMIQGIIQSHGKVLLIMTPIWSLGWNLIFITITLNSIFLIQRSILNYLIASHCADPSTDRSINPPASTDQSVIQDDESILTKTSTELLDLKLREVLKRIDRVVDYMLVIASLGLPIMVGYMLPGQRTGPDQDWWIDWAQTRSFWFWFFISPTPDMSSNPRFKMISNYAPIGWLPFVIFGAFYGRLFLRKKKSRIELFLFHLKFSFYFLIVFLITRLLDVGNFSIPSLEELKNINNDQGGDPGATKDFFSEVLFLRLYGYLRKISLMVWFKEGSIQIFLFTSNFPPDLSNLSLSLLLIFCLIGTFFLIMPRLVLEFNPMIQFGRSAISFYSIQLLSFHYVLPSVLSILDWPSRTKRLNLLSILIINLFCLPIFWLICETIVILKDQKPIESVSKKRFKKK